MFSGSGKGALGTNRLKNKIIGMAGEKEMWLTTKS